MFLLRVITSFFVGGLFVALQTTFAERVSSRWRGLILTIPSTGAISFVFISLTKQTSDVVEVVRFFLASLGACYLFVFCVAIFYKKSIFQNLLLSFAIWSIFSALIITSPPKNILYSIFIYYLPIVFLSYHNVKKLPQKTNIKPFALNYKIILMRSLIAGTIIASAVVLSKTLGNSWGGLFASFPAAFSSTFIIYNQAHSNEILPSVAKSLFFPGSIGFVIYTLVLVTCLPLIGIWFSTITSYLAVGIFYLLYQIIQNYENKNPCPSTIIQK